MAMGHGPFHRGPIEHEHHALEAHHRRARDNAERLGNAIRRQAERDAYLVLAEQNAVRLSEQADAAGDLPLSTRPGTKRCRHRRIRDQDVLAAMAQHSANPIDRSPVGQAQAQAFVLVGRAFGDVHRHHPAVHDLAVGAAKVAEAHGKLIRGLVAHEGSAALAPGYQPLRFQELQGLAHRPRTDAELAGQIALVGHRHPRFPRATCDALSQRVPHLQVKRSV